MYLNFQKKIIECSKKLITMHGDTSNRTYNFINSFGPSTNMVNTIKKNRNVFKYIEKMKTYIKI